MLSAPALAWIEPLARNADPRRWRTLPVAAAAKSSSALDALAALPLDRLERLHFDGCCDALALGRLLAASGPSRARSRSARTASSCAA